MISSTSSKSLSKYSRKNQGEKFFAERSKAGQRELFLSLIFLSCAVNPFLLCRMTRAMNQVQARIRYLEQFFAFFAPNVLPERSSEVGRKETIVLFSKVEWPYFMLHLLSDLSPSSPHKK